MKYKLGLTFT